MDYRDKEIHTLGIFVHGALAALHALGIAYNLRRRNYRDVAIHTGAFIYDVWAAREHTKVVCENGLDERFRKFQE